MQSEPRPRPNPLPSAAMMQEVGESPFMALPTELRCQIYSYLLQLAYQPVFPVSGICRWEVYQMPTALLQLNKIVHEELKDPWIQKPLKKMNNHLLPKINLGPTRTKIDPVYIALSNTFHQAGKRFQTSLGRFQKHGNETAIISLALTSWYNNTYLSGQVSCGEETFDTKSDCIPESLHKFVGQTLKRMRVRETCEIRVRLLVHPVGPIPEGDSGSGKPTTNCVSYEGRAAQDPTRQALSVGMGCELKMVYLSRGCKNFLAPVFDDLQRRGMNIKIAKARARDRQLFDLAISLC